MSFPRARFPRSTGCIASLQRWFRAEGARDPALVLEHFDPGYTMITTAGTLLTLDAFRAALPGFWGSRPAS